MRTLLVVLALGSIASADEVKRTVDAFTGHWIVELALTPPKQATARFKGTIDCKPIAAGTAVDCALAAEVPGMGPMRESDLMGYDPETKSVRIMTWNNQGEIHDHHGAWKDDHTLELSHTATMGGAPVSESFRMAWTAANAMSFRFTSTSGGATSVFEGKATRK
jgi:hypothetical protein